ncbi:hypothetical protein NQ318_011397 [Aromia moschata]|uniref:G-protein coupled receptors family 1 profile domain-containing protein n=1 Tax=Aromia moschata TaxID=1265417 RepID=A0AAV8YT87_9CUCU|nr:hypothetical protein NQ318_011397 [Aromia moschata]
MGEPTGAAGRRENSTQSNAGRLMNKLLPPRIPSLINSIYCTLYARVFLQCNIHRVVVARVAYFFATASDLPWICFQNCLLVLQIFEKISNNWIMGPELCDMWTSIDVLCCTASILHLVAIAVDSSS